MSDDGADPLQGFRPRFALPRDASGQPLVYLCGHSLGLMPLAARQLVDEELDSWAQRGIDGQFSGRRPWIDYAGLLNEGLANLAGAQPHEVVAMNSLTVNLHVLMASFYRPQGARRRILIEAGAFPSDRYAVAGQIGWHGLDPADCLVELAPRAGEDLLRAEDIDEAIGHAGETLALVLWPGVQYLTGQSFDLARIVRAARRAGAAVGFDLAHAIGNVPLALHDSGADFAVWCSYKYLNAGPDDARHGRLRITEAGELIKEKYGLRPIALRIFEQAFNALSLAASGVMPAERVEQRWREAMDLLAAESGSVYRGLVYDDPEFYTFFRQITPIDLIERIQIGSRPSVRVERKGVAALRSIPWSHAWSQSRYMFPGWFGAGSALAKVEAALGAQTLGDMYAHWYFFKNLIDEVELSLARADLEIAASYEGLVDEAHRRFIPVLRDEYALTKDHVLKMKGCARLLDGEPTIQRSIRLRSPYIDPIHLVQVNLLQRWRAGGREDKDLLAALLASVTGISQALQGA